jgi:hypothetical protein
MPGLAHISHGLRHLVAPAKAGAQGNRSLGTLDSRFRGNDRLGGNDGLGGNGCAAAARPELRGRHDHGFLR